MAAEISFAGDDSFEKFPRELIGGSDKVCTESRTRGHRTRH